MMMFDQKKAITSMMGKRKPNGEQESMSPMAPEVVKSDDGEPDGMHAAAQDMIAAFHEKSAMKFAQALCNFLDMYELKDKSE